MLMKNIQNRNLACTSAGRRWGGGGGSYMVFNILSATVNDSR